MVPDLSQDCSQGQEEPRKCKTRGVHTPKNGLIFYPLTPVLHQCKSIDGSTIAKAVGGKKRHEKGLRIRTTYSVSRPELALGTQVETGYCINVRRKPFITLTY